MSQSISPELRSRAAVCEDDDFCQEKQGNVFKGRGDSLACPATKETEKLSQKEPSCCEAPATRQRGSVRKHTPACSPPVWTACMYLGSIAAASMSFPSVAVNRRLRAGRKGRSPQAY